MFYQQLQYIKDLGPFKSIPQIGLTREIDANANAGSRDLSALKFWV